MKPPNLQPSFPGSLQYIGPLFRVDEPVPYDSCNNFYEETKLKGCCDKTFVQ